MDKDNKCKRAGVANIIVGGKTKVSNVYKGQFLFEQVFMDMRRRDLTFSWSLILSTFLS